MQPAPGTPLPEIDGEPDEHYLAQALSRAGTAAESGTLAAKAVLDPHSGTQLVYLQFEGGGRYVLKQLPCDTASWWAKAVGSAAFEVDLWISGVTRSLPSPLRTPALDVAKHTARNEWWILMRDVSGAMLSQENHDAERFGWMIDGLAQFHADRLGLEGGSMPPACSLETHAGIFVEPVLLKLGMKEPDALSEQLAATGPYAETVHLMETVFTPGDLDFVVDLCLNKDRWLAPLLSRPRTLLHGDLQWKHLAPVSPDTVYILDWNLPVAGPPTADLAWCWFLDYWCSLRDPLKAERLRDRYLLSLQNATGGSSSWEDLDREWHLSWLRAFVQLSWCLVAPMAQSPGASSREEAGFKSRRAMKQARWVCDEFL